MIKSLTMYLEDISYLNIIELYIPLFFSLETYFFFSFNAEK